MTEKQKQWLPKAMSGIEVNCKCAQWYSFGGNKNVLSYCGNDCMTPIFF